MRSIVYALVTVSAAVTPAPAATTEPDGTLLSTQPCPANPIRSYEDYVQAFRAELESEAKLAAEEELQMPAIGEQRLRTALLSPQEVAEHLAYRGFECRSITYASGGLKIAGILWKPVDTKGRLLPLVIALRGGNNAFGPMEPWRYWGWHDFLKAGYVVLATQYRGGPGSEGRDGFGSSGDLGDVRNLVPLARSLGYVDTDQIFMHGGSRGGMQAYMLARSGFPARAMAIRAGAADLRGRERPGLFEMQKRLMTDYKSDGDAAIDRRSAVLWADEIKVPTIIFHGTDDWRVSVDQALDVAVGLRKGGTPFEMHLYDGDTHALDLNQSDMNRRAIAFFERYRSR